MKYAIISDVHANPAALETVLADARRQKCEKVILLGDLTGYGYDAPAAIDLARKACTVVLMGNHDSACLGLETSVEALFNPNYDLDRAAYDALSKEQVDWLRQRPYLHEECDFACAHGDFTRPADWNYIFDAPEAELNFAAHGAHILFCGHTHHAAVWEKVAKTGAIRAKGEEVFRQPAVEPETFAFVANKTSRYIINVGSVGYPRNDLCISYVVYDPDTRKVAFRRLPFDFRAYITAMLAHQISLPRWLMAILAYAQRRFQRAN